MKNDTSDRNSNDSRFESIEEIDAADFSIANLQADFMHARPVKINGFLRHHNVAEHWDLQYFLHLKDSPEVTVKRFQEDGPQTTQCQLSEYVASVLAYESRSDNHPLTRPAYCHDIPIFHLMKELIDDVRRLPAEIFPKWYRKEWWQYAQFFLSPKGSVTPLHFDTLLTHNFFFHVCGRKQFTLFRFSDEKYCYRKGWRWFDVDPTRPNSDLWPLYEHASPSKVMLEPGDMLYLPPGTLHHVTSVDASISFNVDIHTIKSIFSSFKHAPGKMPKESLFYNVVMLCGLLFKIPSKVILKYYKSYLNYVS